MRKLIFIAIVFAWVSCKKTEPVPPVNCDDLMKQTDPLYLVAARLDFENLSSINTDASTSVIPIYSRIDSVYAKLKAVRDLATPETDSIFKFFEANYYYTHQEELRKISISYTDSLEALKDIELPKIISKYNLTISQTYKEDNGSIRMTLTSCPFINVNALCREINRSFTHRAFSSISSVAYKYRGYIVTMPLTQTPNQREIIFSVGYGFCDTGCLKWRRWTFSITPNNKVTFVKAWGDPPPPL